MARKAIVTREILSTSVAVLGLNTVTSTAETKTFILSGNVEADKALKVVKKLYSSDEFQPVKVIDVHSENKLLGMWQEDFIKSAFELDPKTRKPLNEQA